MWRTHWGDCDLQVDGKTKTVIPCFTKKMFGDEIVKSAGRSCSCIRLPTIFGQTLRILCQIAFKNAKSFLCADNGVKHWARSQSIVRFSWLFKQRHRNS